MESQASSLRRLTAALGDCVVAGGEETESAQNALGSNDEASGILTHLSSRLEHVGEMMSLLGHRRNSVLLPTAQEILDQNRTIHQADATPRRTTTSGL